MSAWIPCALIIPVEHQDAANRLAAIIDPDTGGAETFYGVFLSAEGQEPATHCGTQTMIAPEYAALLQSGNIEMVFGALAMLATEYGREPPTMDDCIALTENVVCRPNEDLAAVAAELDIVRLPASTITA